MAVFPAHLVARWMLPEHVFDYTLAPRRVGSFRPDDNRVPYVSDHVSEASAFACGACLASTTASHRPPPQTTHRADDELSPLCTRRRRRVCSFGCSTNKTVSSQRRTKQLELRAGFNPFGSGDPARNRLACRLPWQQSRSYSPSSAPGLSWPAWPPRSSPWSPGVGPDGPAPACLRTSHSVDRATHSQPADRISVRSYRQRFPHRQREFRPVHSGTPCARRY